MSDVAGAGEALWTAGAARRRALVRRDPPRPVAAADAAGDDANVAALFYSHEQPLERYNMADTLKAQHTAHLTTGCVCYSDMGRMLCAITADSCGWHDPLCGLTDKAMIEAQLRRHIIPGAAQRAPRQRPRGHAGGDWASTDWASATWSRTSTSSARSWSTTPARWRCMPGHCRAGGAVDLRFEMDTIVMLHAGPHPLATGPRYAPPGVMLSGVAQRARRADDPCRRRCPENERGYLNTERYLAA